LYKLSLTTVAHNSKPSNERKDNNDKIEVLAFTFNKIALKINEIVIELICIRLKTSRFSNRFEIKRLEFFKIKIKFEKERK
jgi:hypothetical protein